METELLVTTTILTECLGPFISVFINLCPQKAPQLVDLMTECFLRPLSFYEQLCIVHYKKTDGDDGKPGDNSCFRRYLDSSTDSCKRISEILLTDHIYSPRSKGLILPIHCLEKAAKVSDESSDQYSIYFMLNIDKTKRV